MWLPPRFATPRYARLRAIGRIGERTGLPPRIPTRRLCLLDLRQGQRPLEPVNGFFLRGGPTRALKRHGRPSPEKKPQLIDCKVTQRPGRIAIAVNLRRGLVWRFFFF